MIYQVKIDGVTAFDYRYRDLVLLEPSLEMEVSAAGSFEFVMPPGHLLYDRVRMLTSDVEVYEDGELIWFGRPVEMKRNFRNERRVYCEGALAFLNDSVQEGHLYRSISLHEFFKMVVAAHNGQVAENRRFEVGRITVPDRMVYRRLRYEQTYDVLKRQCLNAQGGYFFVRREKGVNYLDWLREMPYTCGQPIEFGLNLLDFEGHAGGSDFATCVLPLGEEDEKTHDPVTVESVNSGKKVIESEAAKTYGRITRAVSFEGVTHPDTLYKDGVEYLASLQFDKIRIECEATELHFLNGHYEKFRVGQMVRCLSVPHLVDTTLPLMKMTLGLDSAVKQVTLGSDGGEQSLSEMIEESDAAGEAADEVSRDLEDLRDDYQDTKDSFDQFQEDFQSGQETLDQFKQDFEESQSSFDQFETDFKDMQTDLEGLQKDVEEIKENGSAGGDLSELQDNYDMLSGAVEGLKGQFDDVVAHGGTSDWAHWVGTETEYAALAEKNSSTVYFVTTEEEEVST